GFGAAVQDPQQLPVGPLGGSLRVAGVQRGGGLADVAADVDVAGEDRDVEVAVPGAGADGGDLLFVAVDEEDPLAGPVRVAVVGFAERGLDHAGDAVGDGRGDPFVACLDPAGLFVTRRAR